MFLHLSVSHSVHGGCLHPGGLHPGGGICIQGQGVGRPLPYWILRDTVNERAVHILLEYILVLSVSISVSVSGRVNTP